MKKYCKKRLKWVNTYSSREQKLRICRFLYCINGGPSTEGKGYSAMISLGLQNPFKTGFFRICGEDNHLKASLNHWRVYFLGIVLHHKRTYGGYLS